MKTRVPVIALLAAAFVAMSAPVWAFTSQDVVKTTASVTTGGELEANVSVNLKPAVDPIGGADRSSFTWSGVTPPSTGWKISDTVAVMVATVTNGAVRVYTDNEAGDANPRYVGSGDPAGLLEDDGSGSTDQNLSLAWSIKTSTKVVEGGDADTGIGAADPNNGPDSGRDNRFQWLFLLDKNSGDFSDTNKFTWTHSPAGIHFGQADTEFAAFPDGDPAYYYLQANFNAAKALQAYKTSTFTFESFLE